jgi:hypothetical protein
MTYYDPLLEFGLFSDASRSCGAFRPCGSGGSACGSCESASWKPSPHGSYENDDGDEHLLRFLAFSKLMMMLKLW